MKLQWEDSLAIAITLDDTHPEVDPRSIDLTDLHRWICELKEFDDNPVKPEDKILEAIRLAWIEERE